MKSWRKSVVKALDSIGLKQPVKSGLDRILAAGGLPPVGDPKVFRDLERLVATPRPRPGKKLGKILFFTMRGWTTHCALETMLGEAAAQRGMEPQFYTCGGPLPLCGITSFRAPDPTPCADCHGYASRYFDLLGFPVKTLGDLIDAEDRRRIGTTLAALSDDALEAFEHEGLPLGRMVRTSVLWFLLRGTPEPRDLWLRTFRGFLESGMLVRLAMDRLLEQTRPERILCLNGLFFAERILRGVAEQRGIPYTTYERGFMPGTWLFRHDAVANEFPIAGDFEALAAAHPLDEAASGRLDDYLRGRVEGRSDNRRYWPELEERRQAVIDELGLDPSRPVISVFTNITWDSAVQERDVAFDGMFDWLEQTVRFFGQRDDAQLVIRIHPAEVRLENLESAEGVAGTLERRMGAIPQGVRIVPATSAVSSYTLGGMSRYVLVYTSTMGLEFALSGLPVVVSGETHYRDLGFTHDVTGRGTYPELLERLLRNDPPPVDVERARRYAHFFFFRFMVPLPVVREEAERAPRLPMESLEELGPGRNRGLDAVMDGLIEGKPILYRP